MISLPRELIYQDRKSIDDYTSGNELNKALHRELFGLLCERNKIRMAVECLLGTAFADKILDAFNRAYYYCILVENDRNAAYDLVYLASSSIDDFDVFCMALAILSLQRNMSRNVEDFLCSNADKLIPPFSGVVHRFRAEGKTFDMNFSIRLPDPASLELDWEKATHGFSKKTIGKLVALGKDAGECRILCRKVWDAYRASPHRDMPHVEADEAFFEEICARYDGVWVWSGPEEGAPMPELPSVAEPVAELPVPSAPDDSYWVRKVVDYAKGRHDWTEAKPFREMLDHLLRGTGTPGLFGMVDEIEEHFRRKEQPNVLNLETAGNVIVGPHNVNINEPQKR